jgi:hypothetical protein
LSTLDTILGNPENVNLIKFLFFHHHPFMRDDPFMELKDAGKLWPIIYKRVDVLLFGHKHVSKQWNNKGGVKYILASDNSPGKDYVREVSVVGKEIRVNDVSVA